MRLRLLCCLLLLSSTLGHTYLFKQCCENPTVSTLTGKVSGLQAETSAGTKIYKYLGIPYAEPPVGELRFRDPVAKAPWTGVLNTTQFPDLCLQRSYWPPNPTVPITLIGSEDCLYLNIYTPSPSEAGLPLDLKPVMFWIHGGGFIFTFNGNELTNPEWLIDEDVIVVTINYRLGPFGFLALENNPELAGNIGLKDQQEALKWVNNNIKYFGGDPSRVTLFGQSAGAVSVHAHVLSPRIENMFQGAILQSGNVLMGYAPFFLRKETQKGSQKLLEKIGCEVSDAIKCLQTKDVETLMDFSANSTEEDMTTYWIVQDSASPSPVLPDDPLQQLALGYTKKIPLMLGITKDDGGYLVLIQRFLKDNFEEEVIPRLTFALGSVSNNNTEAEKVLFTIMKRYYLTEGSYDENEKYLIELETDSWFGSSAAISAKLHDSVAPVFPFILNERCTDFSYSTTFGGGLKDYGVTHADDLNCLFKPAPGFGSLTEVGMSTRKAVISFWTNFAKHRNPSPFQTSKPAWPEANLMNIESESGLNTMRSLDLYARISLWYRLYWEPLVQKFGDMR